MLAAQLAVLQPDNPTRLRFIEQLHNVDVLVLDDFLTTPIDAATAHQIFHILAAREHAGSTICDLPVNPKDWYASIPDAVIAESILNRLVAGAEIITLEGPNMRLEANPITLQRFRGTWAIPFATGYSLRCYRILTTPLPFQSSKHGYRHRPLDTRVGTIDVAIPKLRQGAFFPD